MKTNQADKWFSKCARLRTSYFCEYCHKQYDSTSSGLHASHYFGRRSYAVRYDPDNIFAHCYYCHNFLGSNPDIFREWAHSILGEGRIQILRERRDNIDVAKYIKKNIKDVSNHYKLQYELMLKSRQSGNTARIEFINFI
jgi:hypothetical protein